MSATFRQGITADRMQWACTAADDIAAKWTNSLYTGATTAAYIYTEEVVN